MPRPRREGPVWVKDSWYVRLLDSAGKRHHLSLKTDSFEKASELYGRGKKELLNRIRQLELAASREPQQDDWLTLPLNKAVEVAASYVEDHVLDRDPDEALSRLTKVQMESNAYDQIMVDAGKGPDAEAKGKRPNELIEHVIKGQELPITWDELLENSIRRKEEKGKKARTGTIKNVQGIIRRGIPFKPQQAEIKRVFDWREHLLTTPTKREGKPLKPQTIKNYFDALSGLIKQARGCGNPRYSDLPRGFEDLDYSTNLSTSYYTPNASDYTWFFGVLKEQRPNVQLIGRLLMFTGMRYGALKYILKSVHNQDPGFALIPDVDGTKGGVGVIPIPIDLWIKAREIKTIPNQSNLNLLYKPRGEVGSIGDDGEFHPESFCNHSWRHGWTTMSRLVDVPEEYQRLLVGHSIGRDVHSNYGRWPLEKRQQYAEKVWQKITQLEA